MNDRETKQFFAGKPKAPTRVKISGKLNFSNLPVDVQKNIKEKLAEKDDVMAKGLRGELPGLKIDGRQVTRDNIHEFEKKVKVDKKSKKVKLSKKELFAMNKSEQVKLLKGFGVEKIPRLEASRVKKILELQ